VPVFDANFKKLFDAPVLRSPNLSVGLEMYVDALEEFKEPLYKRSVAAYRKEPLPEMPDGFPNSVQPAGGFTMLRTGRNDNDLVSASINWGEPVYRGGKTLLSPSVRWKGSELNAQVMRIAYGSKLSGFSYAATAGNTIVIDGELQSMARAEQRALLDGPCPAGRWTAPATHPQYPGVEWSRSMAICGDSVVVLDQITSAKPVRIDRFTFLPVNEAEAKTADAAEPAFADDKEFCGGNKQYQYLTGVQRVTGKAPERVSFPVTPDKKRIAVVQLRSPEKTQVFRLHAPITWIVRDTQVWALQRTEAKQAWFAEALSGVDTAGGGKADGVQFERVEVRRDGKPLPPEQALAVRVRNAAGEFLVLTTEVEGAYDVAGVELKGPVAVKRRQ
jgi:hypothetical protein